jgi:guanine deaminase
MPQWFGWPKVKEMNPVTFSVTHLGRVDIWANQTRPTTLKQSTIMNDADFMQIAIEESKKGDWPYGAVIVKDGAIVAKGFNTATRDRDTTAHAEVNVIRAAIKAIPGLSLKGCTLYTSSESCPMCTGAEIWAGVSRVVFGASIQQLIEVGQPQINTSSEALIKTAFIKIEITGGVLAVEALQVVRDCKK